MTAFQTFKSMSCMASIGLTMTLHAETPHPNIVIIMADDVGYGDFGCYGTSQIKTPHVDQLASEGVRFSRAFAPASTSSPSRYALLTGEYAWRKRVGILSGTAKLSIDTERLTLPSMLQNLGYRTAVVGKWHLGLGDGKQPLDYNKKITKQGVHSVGFDYSFIYPATNDRVPTIYMEDDLCVGLDAKDPITVSYTKKVGTEPTGKEFPDQVRLKPISGHDGTIINGVGRIGWMSGGKAARWKDEELSDDMLQKAQAFIDDSNDERPFFLYYSTHTAHAPRLPGAAFQGKSKAGRHGDIIEEFDYCVGGIIQTLQKKGCLDDTIVIVTSDNGGVIQTGYYDGSLEGLGTHDPFCGLRGHKGSLYEGGVQVPFIVRWGKGIPKPFVQDQQFCYVDLLATLADMMNAEVKPEELKDSKSAKELIFSPEAKKYRDYILTQNNNGSLSIRYEDWKYIYPRKRSKSPRELFNLSDDPTEKTNLLDASSSKVILDQFSSIIKELNYTL